MEYSSKVNKKQLKNILTEAVVVVIQFLSRAVPLAEMAGFTNLVTDKILCGKKRPKLLFKQAKYNWVTNKWCCYTLMYITSSGARGKFNISKNLRIQTGQHTMRLISIFTL